MKRIWDQSAKADPYWMAKRVKRPLTVAQKEANHVLRKLHKGEQPDLEQYRAQRAAQSDRKQREAAARSILRQIGLT